MHHWCVNRQENYPDSVNEISQERSDRYATTNAKRVWHVKPNVLMNNNLILTEHD